MAASERDNDDDVELSDLVNSAGAIENRHVLFGGQFLTINEHVMTPKLGSECLVYAAQDTITVINDFGNDVKLNTVVDLGTGSGCLLLPIVKFAEYIHGFGFDISEDALGVAQLNTDMAGLSDRVFLKQQSFQDCHLTLSHIKEPFLIVCNPPYLSRYDYEATVSVKSKKEDPEIAMIAGDGKEPLLCYRQVAESIRILRKTQPDCIAALVLEVPARQQPRVKELIEEISGLKRTAIYKDKYGIDRCLIFRPPGAPGTEEFEELLEKEVVDDGEEVKKPLKVDGDEARPAHCLGGLCRWWAGLFGAKK